MNMGVLISLEILISFLLDEYTEVKLLDHMVVLFLILGGTSTLFSTVAAPFAFTPIVYKGSHFSTSSPTHVIFTFFC